MANGRILLIDDEAGIRSSLTQVLSDEGYEVEAVASGEKGLERLRESSFHLVFLDVWLPRKDGMEVLQELRAAGNDVPVVMISGHASIDTAVKATKLGAFDFIEKPLTIEKVSVAVRNALRQRRLEQRNRLLQDALLQRAPRQLIGESPAIVRLREQIRTAAPSNGRVLIFGENGTGKEVVARLLHASSLRADEPFVEMNCAAIPEELIESELFGHVKGSFTGALENKKGKFELADQGTLFLDEIGDMSLKTQSKVLRALQEQTFEPVGGAASVQVDVRVLAATNKDLTEAIRRGEFREDLYFRLNVVPLTVPPLRERKEDIPSLARHFIEELSAEYGKPAPRLTDGALEALMAYPWPGNVRELRNTIERLVIMVPGDRIQRSDLPPELSGDGKAAHAGGPGPLSRELQALLDCAASPSLKEGRQRFERLFIAKKLAECGFNVSRTAEALGVERSHLHRKLKAHGLGPERGESS
ncbi:MAG TPA: sigma-54 dependent transcriptional regulator [Candidatus Polarisedimenticolia bacterium]|nr:sigma-54 dependent transcriptional regulator [Candidatus Polarisedimenticolia bacterium]